MIALNLPVLPGQNVLLRLHWSKRRKEREALAWNVRSQLPMVGRLAPIEKAAVTVTSYRIRLLDPDNLASTVKGLLDILQPFDARRRPLGLGIIAGDDPARLLLTLRQEKVAHRDQQRTRVEINGAA